MGGIPVKKGENLFSVLFLAPAFIIYTVFIILSIFIAIFYTFQDWTGAGAPVFNGIDNYIRLFSDNDYLWTVKNSFILVILAVLIQNPIGIDVYKRQRYHRLHNFQLGY